MKMTVTMPGVKNNNYYQKKRYKKLAAKITAYVFLTIGAVITIIPFLWSISSSLKMSHQIFEYPPRWIPNPVVWKNYVTTWTAVPFGRFLSNSLLLATVVPALQIITSSLAAYAFARLKFPGRDKLFLVYLGSLMLPGQVTVIPNFVIMNYLGWIDRYAALIIPPAFIVFGTFLLRQYFLTLPYELEEAAKIDGCSRFGTFLRIIMPLSKPAVAALAIFQFKTEWNSFLWPLIIMNTPKKMPVQVGLAFFRSTGDYQSAWELILAGTMIAVLPIIIVFLICQKHFTSGMNLSGLADR